MRKRLSTIMAIAAVLGMLFIVGPAMAGDNAGQTVGYEVSPINELAVSGDPGTLNVSTATAGSEPDADSDNTTTYAITTNCGTDAKKITAVLDTAMPANTTLKITLAAPEGATSEGAITLTASAQDVVTAIDAVASSGHEISYELDATVAAGVVASANKTVTLTIVDAS